MWTRIMLWKRHAPHSAMQHQVPVEEAVSNLNPFSCSSQNNELRIECSGSAEVVIRVRGAAPLPVQSCMHKSWILHPFLASAMVLEL